jgi:outer membrane protein TolC
MTLSESIGLALKQNLSIQSAKEKTKGADAQKKEALTGFLPKLSTSYSYSRLNETATYTTPGSSLSLPAPFGTVNIAPSSIVAGTKDNFNWSVDAKQPIFAGGAISANYKINKIGAEISALEEQISVREVVLSVKTAYFNILKANEYLKLAQQSIDQLTSHRNAAQNFYDCGLIPRNDLLRADVEIASGRQRLIRSENSVQMAHAQFNTLLHLPINNPVDIEDILAYQSFDEALDACLKFAQENRPEVMAYTRKLEQARQMVAMTRSEYFPTVSLAGNYTRFGDTASLTGSAYRDQESWYVMAVANWSFWEWGKTKNKVDAVISQGNQMAYRLAALKDQIDLEVKNAYLGLRETEKQILTADKSIEQAEENFRIVNERYKEQMVTTMDIIDAQTLLLRAKSDYTNALGDYNIGKARLDKAMGIPESQKVFHPR